MNKRLPFNSTQIRKSFPKYYEELFSASQVVTSSSDSFFWAGEYARFYGGLVIMQKLPTKTLVGLEVLNERKFCFADSLYGYNPNRESFDRVSFDYAKEIRLINFLKEYWPSIDPQGKIKGFRIRILSESRCGGGLGTTGVVLACLAASLLLLAGKITMEEIESWEKTTVEELINNEKYKSFREVFHLAWRLTAISRDGNSSGAAIFGALIKTSYPIVYFSKNINNYLTHPSIASPKNNLENCSIISEIPFWGNKFEEIFPLRLPQPWPVDIGRIYSGTLINTENIFKSLSRLKLDIENLEEIMRKELSLNIHTEELSINYFFNFDSDTKRKFSYRDYLDIFNITAIKMLLSLKDSFLMGQNEESLRHFISVINQAQDFNHFLGHSTPTLDKICDRFNTIIANENEFNLSGAKIEGIGKGGHVLFVAPASTLSDKILIETEKLAQETNKEIYLDWASWIDGFGESGLVVEQFLPNSKFSSFVSNQSCKLTTFTTGIEENKIIENCDSKSFVGQFDLTLSVMENKIYIKGQPLSSKELSSSKATIEIFKKILRKHDFKLNNREFAQTSYGQNRYDLQSKIFIPLNKALKKFAGKEIDYTITGNMYDDFTVTIDPKNITFAIVENL